jgi:hypothetical protein
MISVAATSNTSVTITDITRIIVNTATIIAILIVARLKIIGGLGDYGVLHINETFKNYF